jgi:ATP-binding cassette, subfamily B, multidrug efflux pump
LASCIMIILIPSEVQNLINNGVLLGDDGRDFIIQSSLRIMLFAFLYTVFMMLSIMMAVAFAEGTGNYIRTRAFEKIEDYSFKNFDQYPPVEPMRRLTSDIYQINIAAQLSMRFLLRPPLPSSSRS